jgi:hypothetical protein
MKGLLEIAMEVGKVSVADIPEARPRQGSNVGDSGAGKARKVKGGIVKREFQHHREKVLLVGGENTGNVEGKE